MPPFGQGGFYSSPAIAFGRVYAGRDDGTIFAFNEKTGTIEWSFSTNNFASSFKTGDTIGIDVRTQRKTFQMKQAAYSRWSPTAATSTS